MKTIVIAMSGSHDDGQPGVKVNSEGGRILVSKNDYLLLEQNMKKFIQNGLTVLLPLATLVKEQEPAEKPQRTSRRFGGRKEN